MKNLTWQNPEQLFVAQVLINKVKSKCCGIKDKEPLNMKSNTTIEGYKNYYASLDFQRDLISWFKIVKSSTRPRFLFIPNVTSHGNPDRVSGMPSQTRENSFYFSFCVFLHALQAQAICKLSGKDMMYRFHAETGVPMISCGLGGIMHPSHILYEAELLPKGAEVPAYIEMIDTILPAIKPQIEELEKYAPIDNLYPIIEKEIQDFRERLANGEKHPTAFLEVEAYTDRKTAVKS